MSTWVLHVAEGGRVRAIPLTAQVSRVGRAPGSEVPLEDPAAPLIGCSLTQVAGGLWLQPFAPVAVNGALIPGAQSITPQDQIAIGSAWLALRAAGEPSPWAAPQATPAQQAPFAPPQQPAFFAPPAQQAPFAQQPNYTASQTTSAQQPNYTAPQPPFAQSPFAQAPQPPFGQPPNYPAPQGPLSQQPNYAASQGPFAQPAQPSPLSPAGAPQGPFAQSPYARPWPGAPQFGAALPPPAPPRPRKPFGQVLLRFGIGLLWITAAWIAAYYAPRVLARARPDTHRAVLVGVFAGTFVLGAVLYYALLRRRADSPTVGAFWGLSLLGLVGFSIAQWEALTWPKVTFYNPTDTALEFAVDGGPRVQVVPGGYWPVEVSPRAHRIHVFANGAPLDAFETPRAELEARYLATPLALGCFTRETVRYSMSYSPRHGPGQVLEVQHGQRFYDTASSYVVEEPPSSMSTSSRGAHTAEVHWFHPLPCDPQNEHNAPLVPLASVIAGATPANTVVAASAASGPQSLSDARRGFVTRVAPRAQPGAAPETPPADVLQLVRYPAAPGPLAAYLTPDPRDGRRHPAIVWIHGGDLNDAEDVWTPAPPENDQTAGAYRRAGIAMMFPSLRGGSDNPGTPEGFYGEVDDVLAAAAYLAQQPWVDPQRIYLGGHSTGGTLAMLVAEASDRFRAVFAFGPMHYVTFHRPERRPFDADNPREAELRSPMLWLASVRSPLFVIEGSNGNAGALEEMQHLSTNAQVQFYSVQNADHFTVLGPANAIIAQRILVDRGPRCAIALTPEELRAALGR